MNLRNLPQRISIGVQLWIGLSFILAFVFLLGVQAWTQTDSLWSEVERMYEHPLPARWAVSELKADILFMHRAVKNAVLAENDAALTDAIQEIDRYEADAHRQLAIIYDVYLGPRSDVEAVESSFVEWRAIREDVIRLLRAGQRSEANARTQANGVSGQHVAQMLAAQEKLSNYVASQADMFYANALAGRGELRRQLIIFGGGILSLVALISYGLLYTIRGPLGELTTVAEAYRDGNFDARSRHASHSGNEFAILATAFNALADSAQREMQSQLRSAQLVDLMLREEELEEFCRALLAALAENTGSQIAAIYLRNPQGTAYEHAFSIGLNSPARIVFDARSLQGEFGAALITKEIQHIADIPANTQFAFATVAGEFRPAAILTIPILSGPDVVAVISLACLRPYSPAALRLVNDIWDVLTARLNGVLAFRQLRVLSWRMEEQNRELEAKTRELMHQAHELSEQNIALEHQRLQVSEANRLKSTFLSTMSHELRTPLNSVIALTGVLSRRLRGVVSEEEQNYLAVIERNGKHLLALINNILDLSRIEASRVEMNLESFSLGELIGEIVALIEPQARIKALPIQIDVAGDLPPITSDATKCRHILQNLIGNAVKFTDTGHVRVSARQEGESMKIAVQDTGIGIAADQIDSIFDEFHQADTSAARKHGGTGLGLSIAQKYAILLQGKITVESSLGRGSTFTLTLPLIFVAEDGMADTRDAPGQTGEGPDVDPVSMESIEHSAAEATR